jgi:hypothetical protein
MYATNPARKITASASTIAAGLPHCFIFVYIIRFECLFKGNSKSGEWYRNDLTRRELNVKFPASLEDARIAHARHGSSCRQQPHAGYLGNRFAVGRVDQCLLKSGAGRLHTSRDPPLPAPYRSAGSHRINRRCHGRAGQGGQGALYGLEQDVGRHARKSTQGCIPSVHFNVNSGNRHRPILEYFAILTATNQKRTGGDGGGYQAEKMKKLCRKWTWRQLDLTPPHLTCRLFG